MRKQFLLLLTALLTLGAASVKAAPITVEFGKANFINNGGSVITQGEITITPACTTPYAIGTKIDAENGMTVANTANNLITRVAIHVSDNTGNGANQILPTSFPPDRVNYDESSQLLTISNIELFDLLIKTWNENDYNFYIDSMAVTYEEVDGTVIRLSAIPESIEAEGTAANVTVHSNAYYTSGPACVNMNVNYIYIKTTMPAVPEIRCHIQGGNPAGLQVSSGSIAVNGNWATITGASTDSISITTSTDPVYFDYFVLGEPTFTDFQLDFRSNPYTVVSGGGLPSCVTLSDLVYNGSQHGLCAGTITVKVDGAVKFTLGGCSYANTAIPVQKDGVAYTTINNKTACDNSGIAGGYNHYVEWTYNSTEAATLTFTLTNNGNMFLPYFFAEATTYVPDVTVTYYDTDGTTFIGDETVAGASALVYAYDEGDVTIASGKAFRGWFESTAATAKKVREGTSLTEDISLYARATDIEVATPGSSFTYDLTKEYFYQEDHELLTITKGEYNNNHGWTISKDGTMAVEVAGNATVQFTLCAYGNTGTLSGKDAGDNTVGTPVDLPLGDGHDGETRSFSYTGAATTLTFTMSNTNYVHAIQVTNDDTSTALDEIVNRQSSNRKFFKDGQLLIEKDGKTYNVLGAEVK